MGEVAIPAFPGEQTLQTGMSQANNREHKHHALCMLVQETSTNEFGCDTTAAGQRSGSPQAGHRGAKTDTAGSMNRQEWQLQPAIRARQP